VVQSELDVDGLSSLVFGISLLGVLLVFAGFSILQKSCLLVFFGLGGILGKQFEELTCLVFVNGVLELVKSGRHLKSLKKNSFLSLNSNVFGPLHKPSKVSLWLDVSSDPEVSWILGEERALDFVSSLFAAS